MLKKRQRSPFGLLHCDDLIRSDNPRTTAIVMICRRSAAAQGTKAKQRRRPELGRVPPEYIKKSNVTATASGGGRIML